MVYLKFDERRSSSCQKLSLYSKLTLNALTVCHTPFDKLKIMTEGANAVKTLTHQLSGFALCLADSVLQIENNPRMKGGIFEVGTLQ